MRLPQDLFANMLRRAQFCRNRRGRRGTHVFRSIPCAESLESRAMLSGVSAAVLGLKHAVHQQPALHDVLSNGIRDFIRSSVPARYQSHLNSLLSSAGQTEQTHPLPAWHNAVTQRINKFIDTKVPSTYQSIVHNAVDAVVAGFHDDYAAAAAAAIPEPALNVVNCLTECSATEPVTASVAPNMESQGETQAFTPAGHDPLTEVIDNVVSSISESCRGDAQDCSDDFTAQSDEDLDTSLPPETEINLTGPVDASSSMVDDAVTTTAENSDSLPAWHHAITETISDVIDHLPSRYQAQAEQLVDHFVANYHDELVTAVDRLPAGLLDEVFSFVGRRRGWLSLFA